MDRDPRRLAALQFLLFVTLRRLQRYPIRAAVPVYRGAVAFFDRHDSHVSPLKNPGRFLDALVWGLVELVVVMPWTAARYLLCVCPRCAGSLRLRSRSWPPQDLARRFGLTASSGAPRARPISSSQHDRPAGRKSPPEAATLQTIARDADAGTTGRHVRRLSAYLLSPGMGECISASAV